RGRGFERIARRRAGRWGRAHDRNALTHHSRLQLRGPRDAYPRERLSEMRAVEGGQIEPEAGRRVAERGLLGAHYETLPLLRMQGSVGEAGGLDHVDVADPIGRDGCADRVGSLGSEE